MKKLFLIILSVLLPCSCSGQSEETVISLMETVSTSTSITASVSTTSTPLETTVTQTEEIKQIAYASVGSALISVEYAVDETLFEYNSYNEFIENKDYEKLVFKTNITVKDFKYIAVSFIEELKFSFKKNGELYSIDEFSPEKPFIVSWREQGLIPHRGFSITDENGITKYFYLSLSGENGSLSLREFKNPYPPESLNEEEAALWNCITAKTDKSICYYDIADYDGSGKLVMFAAANDFEFEMPYELWYTDGIKTMLIDDTKWPVDYFPMQFGDNRYFISNQMNRTGITEVYGVKDGEWYFNFSIGGRLCKGKNEYDENEIIIDTPSAGLSWIYYWLFYDEQTSSFKEYGGVEITLEQFMTMKNAEKILEYGNDRELISIIYRGNGVVNLNYYDESRPLEFNNVSVTARYIDGELVYTDEHDTEYELAFLPDIAVYPDITELFN